MTAALTPDIESEVTELLTAFRLPVASIGAGRSASGAIR